MRKYSRLEKTLALKNRRNGYLYIAVGIIIIFLFGFFGIQLLARLASFISDRRQNDISAIDTTPPISPRLKYINNFVNTATIDLAGNGEPGSTIIVVVNGNSKEILAGSDGEFITQITLSEGDNTFLFFSRDAAGNESEKNETRTIVYDTTLPDLTIDKPADGSSYYGAKQRLIQIEGKSEEESTVTVNDRIVIVESDGSFSFASTLSEGQNKLTIKARDKAGNETQKELTVSFFP